MGCNCKGGRKQVMNNLDNSDFIDIAKRVYNEIISTMTIETLTDIDKMEIMNAYKVLYPNSSATPSIEDAINQIKQGIEIYDVKYKR